MRRNTSLFFIGCLVLALLMTWISPAYGQIPSSNSPVNNAHHGAPELDPGTAATGLFLLAIGILVLIDRRQPLWRSNNA
jgi:hypothetical protein